MFIDLSNFFLSGLRIENEERKWGSGTHCFPILQNWEENGENSNELPTEFSS